MGLNFEDKMRAAIALFHENGHELRDIILRGKRDRLKESCIREGMVKIWERVQGGENIKPIRMSWEAWAEAKMVEGKEYREYEKSREALRQEIKKLKKRFHAALIAVGSLTALCGLWGYWLWLG